MLPAPSLSDWRALPPGRSASQRTGRRLCAAALNKHLHIWTGSAATQNTITLTLQTNFPIPKGQTIIIKGTAYALLDSAMFDSLFRISCGSDCACTGHG